MIFYPGGPPSPFVPAHAGNFSGRSWDNACGSLGPEIRFDEMFYGQPHRGASANLIVI
jgi:hypothetical protein